MSYRENAKPLDEIIPKPFFERHPKLKRMGAYTREWLWGVTVILVMLVFFPGLYYLGGWFGNSVLGWKLGDIVEGPQRWFLGVAMVLTPLALIFGPVWIGRKVRGS